MARTLLGLDIGTGAVRAAEISLKTDPPTLERFAEVPLPPGAIVDGEIVDRAAVVAALKQLVAKGKFSTKKVALGIANQKVIVRQVEFPAMSEDELAGALRFQAQEYIPIPIEDAILDFQVLEETTAASGERVMKVLLVAAQRDMINAFVSVATDAGLDPAAVDLSPFAELRSLASATPLLGPRAAEAIIDIGAGVTHIIVHEQAVPRFVRILPMGGGDITKAVVAGLEVAFEEAESIKARVGLSPDTGAAPTEGAARLIEQRASAFVDEVRGSIDYYLTRPEEARISTVVVTGGGSRLPGLVERLSAALHLPVEEGRPLERLRLGRVSQTSEEMVQMAAVCAVAVGLSMREP